MKNILALVAVLAAMSFISCSQTTSPNEGGGATNLIHNPDGSSAVNGKHNDRITTIQVQVNNGTSQTPTVHLDLLGGADNIYVPASGTYYYNESSSVVGISINSQVIPKNTEITVTLPNSDHIKVKWYDGSEGIIAVDMSGVGG